jgi:hypothetical protein
MCLFYFLEERQETEEEKGERGETVDRQPITKGQWHEHPASNY